MQAARIALAAGVVTVGWTGCKAVDEPFSETFPADGITRVVVSVDAGEISYRATSEDEFVVRGVSKGRGFTQSGASSSNEWSVDVEGNSLQFVGESDGFGTIDVEIEGPVLVDVEAVSPLGNVLIEGADGFHWVEASIFDGMALAGQVNAATLAGMAVELEPSDPGSSTMTATSGDVSLSMPYGAPYDFTVTCAEEESYTITDLGFEDWNEQEVSFSGVTGEGTIVVAVTLEGGTFELTEYELAID